MLRRFRGLRELRAARDAQVSDPLARPALGGDGTVRPVSAAAAIDPSPMNFLRDVAFRMTSRTSIAGFFWPGPIRPGAERIMGSNTRRKGERNSRDGVAADTEHHDTEFFDPEAQYTGPHGVLNLAYGVIFRRIEPTGVVDDPTGCPRSRGWRRRRSPASGRGPRLRRHRGRTVPRGQEATVTPSRSRSDQQRRRR